MIIAILSTLSEKGSTAAGRTLPLAQELGHKNDVHLLWPTSYIPKKTRIHFHQTGTEPFTRDKKGKKRLSGITLIFNMLSYSLIAFRQLVTIKPQLVIIIKTHPQNVLAAWLYRIYTKLNIFQTSKNRSSCRFILDTDDFELMANKTFSFTHRGAIHWAEHAGSRLASHITCASPFLSDHFELLTSRKKPVTLIPTGINSKLIQNNPLPPKTNLLYIGSLSESSGHLISLLPPILHHILRDSSQATLTIAGGGDDIERLKAQFKNLKLSRHVIWIGRFNTDQVPDIIKDASLIIDPIDSSIVARAKSSYRVLLAAASGLPVVTSNIGIRPLLLPRPLYNRFFASPADAKSYAKLITENLNQPLTNKQKEQLQNHAVQFTWENLGSRYEQIFTRLTAP